MEDTDGEPVSRSEPPANVHSSPILTSKYVGNPNQNASGTPNRNVEEEVRVLKLEVGERAFEMCTITPSTTAFVSTSSTSTTSWPSETFETKRPTRFCFVATVQSSSQSSMSFGSQPIASVHFSSRALFDQFHNKSSPPPIEASDPNNFAIHEHQNSILESCACNSSISRTSSFLKPEGSSQIDSDLMGEVIHTTADCDSDSESGSDRVKRSPNRKAEGLLESQDRSENSLEGVGTGGNLPSIRLAVDLGVMMEACYQLEALETDQQTQISEAGASSDILNLSKNSSTAELCTLPLLPVSASSIGPPQVQSAISSKAKSCRVHRELKRIRSFKQRGIQQINLEEKFETSVRTPTEWTIPGIWAKDKSGQRKAGHNRLDSDDQSTQHATVEPIESHKSRSPKRTIFGGFKTPEETKSFIKQWNLQDFLPNLPTEAFAQSSRVLDASGDFSTYVNSVRECLQLEPQTKFLPVAQSQKFGFVIGPEIGQRMSFTQFKLPFDFNRNGFNALQIPRNCPLFDPIFYQSPMQSALHMYPNSFFAPPENPHLWFTGFPFLNTPPVMPNLSHPSGSGPSYFPQFPASHTFPINISSSPFSSQPQYKNIIRQRLIKRLGTARSAPPPLFQKEHSFDPNICLQLQHKSIRKINKNQPQQKHSESNRDEPSSAHTASQPAASQYMRPTRRKHIRLFCKPPFSEGPSSKRVRHEKKIFNSKNTSSPQTQECPPQE